MAHHDRHGGMLNFNLLLICIIYVHDKPLLAAMVIWTLMEL